MKKTTKKVSEPDFSTEKVTLELPKKINLLELDLGREDLNSLVGKLNEVINKVNG